MTVERMIELLEIEKECVLRNAIGECNRYCAGCDLLQDDTELHEMYTEAIALLKAQEPRVMTLEEVKLASENAEPVCVETADGELRWALTYPGIEPPKERFRYPGGVLFDAVDVNDEIYDGDFYGMTMPDGRPHGLGWRAWTSRPTDEQREKEPWNG